MVGATILLYDIYGNNVASATTDENGSVSFHGLPGSRYSVQAIYPECPSFPPSVAPSITSSPTPRPTRTGITGQVNDPCVAGDVPLAGVTVRLVDVRGDTIQSTTTDSNGVYVFASQPPGTRYGISIDYPDC